MALTPVGTKISALLSGLTAHWSRTGLRGDIPGFGERFVKLGWAGVSVKLFSAQLVSSLIIDDAERKIELLFGSLQNLKDSPEKSKALESIAQRRGRCRAIAQNGVQSARDLDGTDSAWD